MPDIPQEHTLDATLALLREGYTFIQSRCRKYDTDIFQTRLMGEKVVCMLGEDAASVFYDEQKFRRRGAMPKRVQKTLVGEHGVQTLDAIPHEHRKAMFMSLMTAENIDRLVQLHLHHWRERLPDWERRNGIVLFDEMRCVLAQAVCEWTGVPLEPAETDERSRDFIAMVYAFGAVGPRHWKGRFARRRVEDWIERLVRDVRAGDVVLPEGPAGLFIAHHDVNGDPLPARVAAVEIINVLRPVVAVATYITFAALALRDYPETRTRIEAGDDEYLLHFVQEVRRFYPFGPFLGARVQQPFIWRDHRFEEGTLVLLDMYGTNHDPRRWHEPDAFRPERFAGWEGNAFDFIPQGGGSPDRGHRCAGERITLDIVAASVRLLVNEITYQVPADQNLEVNLRKMPTLPESGFVMEKVKEKCDLGYSEYRFEDASRHHPRRAPY